MYLTFVVLRSEREPTWYWVRVRESLPSTGLGLERAYPVLRLERAYLVLGSLVDTSSCRGKQDTCQKKSTNQEQPTVCKDLLNTASTKAFYVLKLYSLKMI